MTLYIDDIKIELNEEYMKRHYINSGCEGSVYYYNGMAIKLYHDRRNGKDRLSLESCKELLNSNTQYILLPIHIAYDENKNYNGYCTYYIVHKSSSGVFRLDMRTFIERFFLIDGEIRYLASRNVKVSDLMMANFRYNDYCYFVDPGDFKIVNDSEESIYSDGQKQLAKFIVWDIFAATAPLSIEKKKKLMAIFLEDDTNILATISKEAKPDESVREFIKRITS